MEMVRKDFTTGLVRYMKDVTTEALKKRDLLPGSKCTYESEILKTLDETSEQIVFAMNKLAEDTAKAEQIGDFQIRCSTDLWGSLQTLVEKLPQRS